MVQIAARPGSPESLQQLVEIAKNPAAANAATLSSVTFGKEDSNKQSRDKKVSQNFLFYNIELWVPLHHVFNTFPDVRVKILFHAPSTRIFLMDSSETQSNNLCMHIIFFVMVSRYPPSFELGTNWLSEIYRLSKK